MVLDVKYTKEHMIVWFQLSQFGRHTYFIVLKSRFFAQMGQVTLKNFFTFIKYFWCNQPHKIWHSDHHIFLFGVPINKLAEYQGKI